MINPLKHALVAGANGVTGSALVRHLARTGEWKVTALARRQTPQPAGVSLVVVDLLDRAACAHALRHLEDVTHVFFAAFQDGPSYAAQVSPNLAMLSNLVEGIEGAAPDLSRVVIVQGVKYYGVHLGRFKTPASEDDPRHLPPNFYYDQEDYLRGRQRDAAWTWSAVRPGTICGYSIGSPMNFTMIIAVYAAICKGLGLPLRFPGTQRAWHALREFTDADLLARAIEWAGTTDECAGEAFNIKNGEPVRLEHLWPELARMFEIGWDSPQGLRLVSAMADKEALWDGLTAKHGLVPHRYADLVQWQFGDYLLGYEHDIYLDGSKARRFGFTEQVDHMEMFERLLREFRERRVIP